MSIFESIKDICEMGREHFPELAAQIDEAEEVWDDFEKHCKELAKKNENEKDEEE